MTEEVIDRVRRRLAQAAEVPSISGLAEVIRGETGGLLADRDLLGVLRRTHDEVDGAGPLQRLLAEPDITDVVVNGPADVWVDRGTGLTPASVTLGAPDDVRDLAQRLAARAGRRLDAAHPWVDATLPDGSRLHAVLPPVAADCALISVRVPRRHTLSLAGLVDAGLDPEVADLLVAIVRSRLSFLVSGGTGSGKTTLLTILLEEVDAGERVLVVEDVDELRPSHPHTVKLLSRPSNIEGAGEVTLQTLVRQALRMRPDRIVVGEVRGGEVAELLLALNTGHRGGAGTIHANGIAEVPARVRALGALAGMSAAATDAQLCGGIDVLIHLSRTSTGAREVNEIGLLERVDDRPKVVPVWRSATGFRPEVATLRDRMSQSC